MSKGHTSTVSRKKSFWEHGLTLLVITTTISVIGFFIVRFMDRDRTDLRFEIQDVKQGVKLLDSATPPTLNDETVFHETAVLDLMLAHNGDGKATITVLNLKVDVEEIPLSKEQADLIAAAVDPLDSQPFGFKDRGVYVLTLQDSGHSVQYITDIEGSQGMSSTLENVLLKDGKLESIDLSTSDSKMPLKFYVLCKSNKLHRVRFVADYDVDKRKPPATTKSFLITK